MGFNSAFKGLKLLKTPVTGVYTILNDPVLNVLRSTVKEPGYSFSYQTQKFINETSKQDVH